MNILLTIILIWLILLVIGSIFGILGKIIWLAILLSIISAVWGYLQR